MFVILYYLVYAVLCIVLLLVSAVVFVAAYPFDRRRHAVHELSRLLAQAFFRLPPAWRVKVVGRERIGRGPYIIVLNHSSMIDIPLFYFIPLDFRWVSKREVFRMPIVGQLLWLHGDIAIERRQSAAAMSRVMHEGREWLGRGVSVAIFPEGTRSPDGTIRRFRAGAFALAHEGGADVLPVVIEGSRELVRGGWRLPWRHRFTLRVLDPIPAAEVARSDARELAEEVRRRMTAARTPLSESPAERSAEREKSEPSEARTAGSAARRRADGGEPDTTNRHKAPEGTTESNAENKTA